MIRKEPGTLQQFFIGKKANDSDKWERMFNVVMLILVLLIKIVLYK